MEIAIPSENNPHIWEPGRELANTVKRAGFVINSLKTRMQYRDSRQEVTGLVVNQKINVRREYRHNVRAMVHSLLKSGSFETLVPGKDASGNLIMKMESGTLEQLNGMLGFIGHTDLYNKKKAEQTFEKPNLSKKEATYRKFLLYREFYAGERPVIICEGGTDNVYLVHAIRRLAASFPDLAQIAPDGKITLKVRLYKHSGTNTARIVDLGDGGSASLAKFIGTYHKEVGKFTAPGQNHAVVVIYDNDSGATAINSIIKQLTTGEVTGIEPFVRIVRNLYAVRTPPTAAARQSKIEDFFEQAVKATVIEGKTFSDGNAFDSTRHYGKSVFAHKVVRPGADTISFDGFIPLLTNVVAALRHHSTANGGAPQA